MPKKSLTCRVCAKSMWNGSSSLPQGEATCHTCRRANPAPRKTYKQKPSTALSCADCGQPMWKGRTSLSQGKARCLQCRRAHPAKRANPAKQRPDIRSRGFCANCAHWFESGGKGARYCSVLCANRGKAGLPRPSATDQRTMKTEANARKNAKRRARLKGFKYVETVDRVEIFERDGWKCRLCGEPVDREAQFPDLRFPTIDHVTPLSRGGEHSRRNVQLAHFGCNVRKGNRELALVG